MCLFSSFFHHMIARKQLWKILFFHLKSSFRSQDIQIFVFLSSPLISPVGHCLRGWSKINLKVYGFINCLNKNLTTHFVWYLGKEKGMIFSMDRVLKKEYFYGKIMQKCGTKTSPRSLLNFGQWTKTAVTCKEFF